MTIDLDKLNALADRTLNERRFCADDYHKELAKGVQALAAEVSFLLESRAEARAQRNRIGDDYDQAVIDRDQFKAANDVLRKALGDLLALYEGDEGCRELAEYIAGRAAMAKERGQ